MDESLATAAIDLSGRPFLVFRGQLPQVMIGQFPAELAEEFFRGFSSAGLFNLHLEAVYGTNSHHLVEALFKACARALRQAIENDVHAIGVSSLAAGHKTLIPELIRLLREAGRGDIRVTAGGVIPPQDYDYLREADNAMYRAKSQSLGVCVL